MTESEISDLVELSYPDRGFPFELNETELIQVKVVVASGAKDLLLLAIRGGNGNGGGNKMNE